MAVHSGIVEEINFGRKALRRQILVRTTTEHETSQQKEPTTDGSANHLLNLMMLGCEDKGPYGPTEHTATMFLNLISEALDEIMTKPSSNDNNISSTRQQTSMEVRITIYRVQQNEYPQTTEEWDSYHGVLLPGSFSSAYDPDPWITTLRQVIQKELYGRGRPTLGVCFGHQLYAHSFSNGKASKVPAGPQGGRKVFSTTLQGKSLLHQESLDLYYTHGDMVHSLPSCAVSLGGNDRVPIQAAAYYSFSSDVEDLATKRPIAITFQSHPEYATAPSTLYNILEAMATRGDLTDDERKHAVEDAEHLYDDVRRQSLHVMIASGRLLGWFPAE